MFDHQHRMRLREAVPRDEIIAPPLQVVEEEEEEEEEEDDTVQTQAADPSTPILLENDHLNNNSDDDDGGGDSSRLDHLNLDPCPNVISYTDTSYTGLMRSYAGIITLCYDSIS